MQRDRLVLTRRRLLQASLFIVFGTIYLALLWRSKWLRGVARRFFEPRLDASSPTGTLSNDEKETILSFAEVLVKEKTFDMPERRYLIEYIDYRTRNTPGYYSLYRTTARLLNHLTQTRFSNLDLRSRATLLVRQRLISYPVRTGEFLLPFQRKELTIRGHAVPDLIRGYYNSPAGWDLVGYKIFPGRCSNLIRYTQPEV